MNHKSEVLGLLEPSCPQSLQATWYLFPSQATACDNRTMKNYRFSSPLDSRDPTLPHLM